MRFTEPVQRRQRDRAALARLAARPGVPLDELLAEHFGSVPLLVRRLEACDAPPSPEVLPYLDGVVIR
jgi:hypothetical protein